MPLVPGEVEIAAGNVLVCGPSTLGGAAFSLPLQVSWNFGRLLSLKLYLGSN